jgi:nucleolar GTP-binding protein
MSRRSPSRPTASNRPNSSGGLPSTEILDIAFHRASLVTPHGETKASRDRRRAELKIVRSSATVLRHLRLETRPFVRPPLSDFQHSLLAGAFGGANVDRALLRVRRAEERIRGVAREAERALRTAQGPDEIGAGIRSFYGRLSSFVREVDRDIRLLRDAAQFLKQRPRLDPGAPTLVVAGFPNVGKSSLVARLSSAHPKIADYPFTTLAISVGHADLGFDRLQVVDTPGVLGRTGRENPAEREATTTVGQAATVVLFVMDPTEGAEHSLAEQEALLERWRSQYPQLPFVIVDSKCDVVRRDTGHLHVSAVTGEGLDELRRAIRGRIPATASLPPVEEAVVNEDAFERLGVEDLGDAEPLRPARPKRGRARK